MTEADPQSAADVVASKLRAAGLLDAAEPAGFYRQWLENAVRRGVEVRTMILIARENRIDQHAFAVLGDLEEITDRDGKAYFLLPRGITAEAARRAVLMTYVLNAGTDYGTASRDNDFAETPYSEKEVARIATRQKKNAWSYADAVAVVANGGQVVATPNGMLMGLGGSWLEKRRSLQGGTTWGEVFLLNIDAPSRDEAAEMLRTIVRAGVSYKQTDDGRAVPRRDRLDLDRLLHHEEIHAQQWAEHGRARFAAEYLGSGALGWIRSKTRGGDGRNRFEKEAGLSDGGYH